ncbi:MAG: hypothetical protein V2J07_10305, partial [Anaerolineae bacterium]|nr:hypothetical protein [Anaerolineae bacterium]
QFFWLSAISTGIAFGLKLSGAFFVLVIPTYLLFTVKKKKATLRKVVLYAAGFVILMLVTIVLTNPLLLTGVRSQFIQDQLLQIKKTSQGILIDTGGFSANLKLPSWFFRNYGSVFFFLYLLTGFIMAIKEEESRTPAILLICLVIPYCIGVLNSAAPRLHYWLAAILPSYLLILPLIPDHFIAMAPGRKKVLQWSAVVLTVLQAGFFLVEDYQLYTNMLQKEETSAALQFSAYVKAEIIHPAYNGQPFIIYRDWHIYYPDDGVATTIMDWELADYALVRENQPDFLLLERANVVTYGDPEYLANSPDAERTKRMHIFYADALNDQIEGYSLIYSDNFGMVYQKTTE